MSARGQGAEEGWSVLGDILPASGKFGTGIKGTDAVSLWSSRRIGFSGADQFHE
jgi:hypothetical protein